MTAKCVSVNFVDFFFIWLLFSHRFFFSLSVKLNWEITTTNIIIKFIADLRSTLQFKSIKTTICSIAQNTVSFDGFITFNWLGCNGLAHVHYVPFRQNSMNLFGSFSKWMMICSARTHTLFDISLAIDAIWRIWPLKSHRNCVNESSKIMPNWALITQNCDNTIKLMKLKESRKPFHRLSNGIELILYEIEPVFIHPKWSYALPSLQFHLSFWNYYRISFLKFD